MNLLSKYFIVTVLVILLLLSGAILYYFYMIQSKPFPYTYTGAKVELPIVKNEEGKIPTYPPSREENLTEDDKEMFATEIALLQNIPSTNGIHLMRTDFVWGLAEHQDPKAEGMWKNMISVGDMVDGIGFSSLAMNKTQFSKAVSILLNYFEERGYDMREQGDPTVIGYQKGTSVCIIARLFLSGGGDREGYIGVRCGLFNSETTPN